MLDIQDKKVALFGGSFNPVHIGHLLTGFDIIEKSEFDYILYIPTNIPTHKEFKNAAEPEHRLNMLKIAINNIDCFGLSDVEIIRGGYSYTIDTVEEMMEKYKIKNKLGIVIGDDLIEDLDKWKDIDRLNKLSDFICLYRNNDMKLDSPYDLKWIKNRRIEVSSTEIRNRIINNLPINYLVSNGVRDYILKNKIYRI